MDFLNNGLVEKSSAILRANDFENFYDLEVKIKMFVNDYEDSFSSKLSLKNKIDRQISGIFGSNTKYISHNILVELHFIKTHVANCNGIMLFLEKFENEDGTYYYKELKHKNQKIELVKIDHVSKNGEDWVETETWAAKIFENIRKEKIYDVVLKNEITNINTLQEGPGVKYYEKDNSSP